MEKSTPVVFINRHRRTGGIIVAIGVVLLGFGVIFLSRMPASLSWDTPAPKAGAPAGEFVAYFGMLFGLIIGPVLLLIGGIALKQGSIAERDFDRFRRGEHLAHWTFAPAEWDRFVAGRYAARMFIAKLAFWGIIGLGILPMVIAAVIILVSGKPGRPLEMVAWLVGVPLLGGAVYGAIWWSARLARDEVRRGGAHAFIGRDAAYCAGDYAFWGRKEFGRYYRLRGARLRVGEPGEPGEPAYLNLTVLSTMTDPANRGGRAAVAVAVAAEVAAGAAGTEVRRDMKVTRIPIPGGCEADAERVADILRGKRQPDEVVANGGGDGRA